MKKFSTTLSRRIKGPALKRYEWGGVTGKNPGFDSVKAAEGTIGAEFEGFAVGSLGFIPGTSKVQQHIEDNSQLAKNYSGSFDMGDSAGHAGAAVGDYFMGNYVGMAQNGVQAVGKAVSGSQEMKHTGDPNYVSNAGTTISELSGISSGAGNGAMMKGIQQSIAANQQADNARMATYAPNSNDPSFYNDMVNSAGSGSSAGPGVNSPNFMPSSPDISTMNDVSSMADSGVGSAVGDMGDAVAGGGFRFGGPMINRVRRPRPIMPPQQEQQPNLPQPYGDDGRQLYSNEPQPMNLSSVNAEQHRKGGFTKYNRQVRPQQYTKKTKVPDAMEESQYPLSTDPQMKDGGYSNSSLFKANPWLKRFGEGGDTSKVQTTLPIGVDINLEKYAIPKKGFGGNISVKNRGSKVARMYETGGMLSSAGSMNNMQVGAYENVPLQSNPFMSKGGYSEGFFGGEVNRNLIDYDLGGDTYTTGPNPQYLKMGGFFAPSYAHKSYMRNGGVIEGTHNIDSISPEELDYLRSSGYDVDIDQ